MFYHLEDLCFGTRKSKKRFTALMGCNMDGTHKLPLLILGHFKKPRCFNHQIIPVKYEANKNAWMTSAIFEKFLSDWNEQLKTEDRHILVVIDGATGHKKDKKAFEMSNIEFLYLPSNTTSLTQPLDRGIIAAVKMHYRRLFLRKRIEMLNKGSDFTPNLLRGMRMFKDAWENGLKSDTIVNCFKSAAFYGMDQVFFYFRTCQSKFSSLSKRPKTYWHLKTKITETLLMLSAS